MAGKPSFLVAGILLLFGAALALIAVLGSLIGTASNPPDVGLASFSAACGTLLGIFGLGLVLLYRQKARHDARLEMVVAVLEHVTEISVAEVARTIHATPAEIIALITDAIQLGRVSGYLDPRDGRFVRTVPGFPGSPAPSHGIVAAYPPTVAPAVAASSPADTIEPRFCRECGSRIQRSPDSSGFLCPNCGHREPG